MAEAVANNLTLGAQPGFNGAVNPEAKKTSHSSDAGSANTPTALEDYADEKAAPMDAAPEGPPRKVKGIVWVVVVIAILSSTFLFALDNTIVADIEPNIVETFGEIGKLPWLPIAFLLAAVSTNLIW